MGSSPKPPILAENPIRDKKGRKRGMGKGMERMRKGERREGRRQTERRKAEKVLRALVFLIENVKKLMRIYFNTY